MKKENDIREAFKKTLVALRNEKGLSQMELAQESDLHRNYISFLETGTNIPTILTLYKLSDALDMTITEFLGEVEKNLPGPEEG